jgi:hypothetical protein
MVRRGSTVRVRQRASGFSLLRAVSVGCGGDGLLVKCPRDVHAVDTDLFAARVPVEEVEPPERRVVATSVAAAWLVAVLHLSGELTRREAAEDVAEKVTP